MLELLKKLKNCKKCNSIQRGQKGLICPENQDIVPGSLFHHIMVQGINKEFIFDDKECVQEYKKIIIEKLKDSNINILAYCIMNNHAHFLIYSPQIEYIVKFMQKINTTYSRFYNKKFNRVGYVYRDRYKSQTIVDRKHLINCLIYIHNNPLKAGIVSRVQDYKYSSYREYKGGYGIFNSKLLEILQVSENEIKSIILSQSDIDSEEFASIDFQKEIDKFIEKKGIKSIAKLNKSDVKKELIVFLKDTCKMKNVDIAKALNISRTTIYRILHN